jgi:hypothetical protein
VELASRRSVMSSVGKAVSVAAGRVLPRPRSRTEGYAFCAADSFWFRPAYTDGRCPLCGEVAPAGAGSLPRLARVDRSWLGVGALAVESLVMVGLVLYLYFRG